MAAGVIAALAAGRQRESSGDAGLCTKFD